MAPASPCPCSFPLNFLHFTIHLQLLIADSWMKCFFWTIHNSDKSTFEINIAPFEIKNLSFFRPVRRPSATTTQSLVYLTAFKSFAASSNLQYLASFSGAFKFFPPDTTFLALYPTRFVEHGREDAEVTIHRERRDATGYDSLYQALEERWRNRWRLYRPK